MVFLEYVYKFSVRFNLAMDYFHKLTQHLYTTTSADVVVFSAKKLTWYCVDLMYILFPSVTTGSCGWYSVRKRLEKDVWFGANGMSTHGNLDHCPHTNLLLTLRGYLLDIVAWFTVWYLCPFEDYDYYDTVVSWPPPSRCRKLPGWAGYQMAIGITIRASTRFFWDLNWK